MDVDYRSLFNISLHVIFIIKNTLFEFLKESMRVKTCTGIDPGCKCPCNSYVRQNRRTPGTVTGSPLLSPGTTSGIGSAGCRRGLLSRAGRGNGQEIEWAWGDFRDSVALPWQSRLHRGWLLFDRRLSKSLSGRAEKTKNSSGIWRSHTLPYLSLHPGTRGSPHHALSCRWRGRDAG